MADATLQHDTVHGLAGAYEAPLFGAYSKKVGMWLFLASDSLTFGALLFAYTYVRVASVQWPTPFRAWPSIANASLMTVVLLSSSLTMVMAVRSARIGSRSHAVTNKSSIVAVISRNAPIAPPCSARSVALPTK